MSRAKFLKSHPQARSIAALKSATAQAAKWSPGAIRIPKDHFAGKTAVIIGSGIGGLTTAYELLAQHSSMKVIVLEAQGRTGGRCLTLRTGDTFTEDKNSDLFGSEPGETQVVRFKRPTGDAQPYLNAGPGRIPSSHKRLLAYLKKFSVDVQVYVMNSQSNLVQMKDGPVGDLPMVYRQLEHNTRGWLAQAVHDNARLILESQARGGGKVPEDRVLALQELMVSFGELAENGEYEVTAGEDGMENARSRAGFSELPGVSAGKIAEALSFEALLDSKFWEKTRFFQPSDFLWQETLFQPVGGMDQVQHAFAQQVAALGGEIYLHSPVKTIDWDSGKEKFIVSVAQVGTEACIKYEADYCFSNVAMPFLSRILSPELINDSESQGLAPEFKSALKKVFEAQFIGKPRENDCQRTERFLACTTKVGWQGKRRLWQGGGIKSAKGKHNTDILDVDGSELGIVPIFGGISWTDNAITQIWYPSNDFHDELGVLTGAYNFAVIAEDWGQLSPQDRLRVAKEGARLFGQRFGDGLEDGVTIAWQNMPYIKGGWAQWHVVDDPEDTFNVLTQGSGIYDQNQSLTPPRFFIVGDQLSSLPGWQEGAIASALNALSRACRPDLAIPHLAKLPDVRLMVEGV